MLQGVHPLLTGEILKHLDEMGHRDTLVVVDGHFPAPRTASRVTQPGSTTRRTLEAVLTVFPLDDGRSVTLMNPPNGELAEVQQELLETAGVTKEDVHFVDRFEFYHQAEAADLVVRTGEARPLGCIMLRKGIVTRPAAP